MEDRYAQQKAEEAEDEANKKAQVGAQGAGAVQMRSRLQQHACSAILLGASPQKQWQGAPQHSRQAPTLTAVRCRRRRR